MLCSRSPRIFDGYRTTTSGQQRWSLSRLWNAYFRFHSDEHPSIAVKTGKRNSKEKREIKGEQSKAVYVRKKENYYVAYTVKNVHTCIAGDGFRGASRGLGRLSQPRRNPIIIILSLEYKSWYLRIRIVIIVCELYLFGWLEGESLTRVLLDTTLYL